MLHHKALFHLVKLAKTLVHQATDGLGVTSDGKEKE
jgi:hypothetical protein